MRRTSLGASGPARGPLPPVVVKCLERPPVLGAPGAACRCVASALSQTWWPTGEGQGDAPRLASPPDAAWLVQEHLSVEALQWRHVKPGSGSWRYFHHLTPLEELLCCLNHLYSSLFFVNRNKDLVIPM